MDAFAGRPVWLASVAARDSRGEIIPTAELSPSKIDETERFIQEKVLAGVGDVDHARFFRMCATLCYHRALTAKEAEGLPEWWKAAPPVHLAGGPVEVLWEKNCPDWPATRPCANPRKVPLDGPSLTRQGPVLYFPEDCGRCETCRARDLLHHNPHLTPAELNSLLAAGADAFLRSA